MANVASMKKVPAVPLVLLLASCGYAEPWLPARSRSYQEHPSGLTPRVESTDPADGWAGVGEPCVLGDYSRPVPAASHPDRLDRLMALANAGDTRGVQAYLDSGDAWQIDGGTPATVIDRIGNAVLVSLGDGSQAWVLRPSALR